MRTKYDRFSCGKGWLQGTQAFLQIGSRETGSGGGGESSSTAAAAAIAPSSEVSKGRAEKGEDVTQVLITVSETAGCGTEKEGRGVVRKGPPFADRWRCEEGDLDFSV